MDRPDSLSRGGRVLICVAVLGVMLGLAYLCLLRWPPAPSRGYSLLDAALPPASGTFGQRFAHRVMLGILAVAVLLAPFYRRQALWLTCGRGLHAAWRRVRRVRLGRSRWLCALLLVGLTVRLAPSLKKVPDFSAYDEQAMAVTNMHLNFTMSHADRLAAGDVLCRETTPKYGVLFPVLLAAAERVLGMLSLGGIFRVLLATEMIFLVGSAWLFARWSRYRWALCLLPFLLLLPFYYSHANVCVAPNHNPWRWFGIPLALLVLALVRGARPAVVHYLSGFVCGVAVLINVESGIAAVAGVLAFNYFRYVVGGNRVRSAGLVRIGVRLAAGLLGSFVGFVLLCKFALGSFPSFSGLLRMAEYALKSADGLGSYPYEWTLWPVVMFAHTAAVLLYTALQRPLGFRQSFRAAVCAILVVWFAYYANRPQQGYQYSYYFLYGFLLIDTGRYALFMWRRPRQFRGVEAAVATCVLLLMLPVAARSVEWSWDPRQWAVKSDRWCVPLSPRHKPASATATLASKTFLSAKYAAALSCRADFLRRKAHGGRLIYFTLDSYLLPRLSGVLPLQEFADPVEALDDASFRRLCGAVRESGQEEIYFEARDETKVLWYGKKFRQLREELGSDYRLTGVDSGWEVWKRRSAARAGR